MDKAVLIFGDKRIRRIWLESEWFFSFVDVVGVLTGSLNPRDYWYRVKSRELEDGIELSIICRQLKMISVAKDDEGMIECRDSAIEGGEIAGNTRREIEAKTGKRIVSKRNFIGKDKEKEKEVVYE